LPSIAVAAVTRLLTWPVAFVFGDNQWEYGNNKTDTRTKVLLLLLDKLVLALIIASAGFFFNFLLQQEKTHSDYQKQIFDRRVQAYVTILEEAKRTRDQLAILYGVDEDGSEALGELGHKMQLEGLSWKARTLETGFGHSSRGGGVTSRF